MKETGRNTLYQFINNQGRGEAADSARGEVADSARGGAADSASESTEQEVGC